MLKIIQLAVVVPIYNEERNIEAVLVDWIHELTSLGIPFIFLAINDGSKDNTGAVLRDLETRYPGLLVAVEKKNEGHGRACRTGYSIAVERSTEWTLQIDSDGQCDPKYFASFWSSREQVDLVYGMRKTRDDGFSRVLISASCRLATSLLCGIDLKDANVPYRLIRTSVLANVLAKIPEDFDMQNVALTVALKRDPSLRWKYIPIHFRDRQGGTNSINLKRIVIMGWELLANFYRIRR